MDRPWWGGPVIPGTLFWGSVALPPGHLQVGALPPLPTPVEFWTSVRDRSQPGSTERVLAEAWLERLARSPSPAK